MRRRANIVNAFELVSHCFGKVSRSSRVVAQLQFSHGVFVTRRDAWESTNGDEKFGPYLSEKRLRVLRKAGGPFFGYSVNPVQVALRGKSFWALERKVLFSRSPRKQSPLGVTLISVESKVAQRISFLSPIPRKIKR